MKTVELATVFENIAHEALQDITADRNELLSIVENIVQGLYDSVIISTDRTTAIPVTGGLPSGLFITSIAGDGFNLAICTCVRWILAQLLGADPYTDEQIDIQGDDASFMHTNVKILQLTDWLLTHVGAEGATGKFGITTSKTEFLRVSFMFAGSHGYPARSMPGIVQRKPWSDEPAKEHLAIKAVHEALDTCTRRGCVFPKNIRTVLNQIWARRHNTTTVMMHAPEPTGLGIKPLNPNIKFTAKRVETEDYTRDIKPEITSTTRTRIVTEELEKANLPVEVAGDRKSVV